MLLIINVICVTCAIVITMCQQYQFLVAASVSCVFFWFINMITLITVVLTVKIAACTDSSIPLKGECVVLVEEIDTK